MIYSDYYTASEIGKFFCVLFFYAVYPIISVNFNTYILLVLNQFLAFRRPLQYGTQVWTLEFVGVAHSQIYLFWDFASVINYRSFEL